MKFLFIPLCLFVSLQSYAQSNGNAFNPKIGVNALFLSQTSKRDRADDGMKLKEAEVQFSSDIDTSFTAKILMSVAKDINGDYAIEPEEAYVETIDIPT